MFYSPFLLFCSRLEYHISCLFVFFVAHGQRKILLVIYTGHMGFCPYDQTFKYTYVTYSAIGINTYRIVFSTIIT